MGELSLAGFTGSSARGAGRSWQLKRSCILAVETVAAQDLGPGEGEPQPGLLAPFPTFSPAADRIGARGAPRANAADLAVAASGGSAAVAARQRRQLQQQLHVPICAAQPHGMLHAVLCCV